jgi:hypothetical protein
MSKQPQWHTLQLQKNAKRRRMCGHFDFFSIRLASLCLYAMENTTVISMVYLTNCQLKLMKSYFLSAGMLYKKKEHACSLVLGKNKHGGNNATIIVSLIELSNINKGMSNNFIS